MDKPQSFENNFIHHMAVGGESVLMSVWRMNAVGISVERLLDDVLKQVRAKHMDTIGFNYAGDGGETSLTYPNSNASSNTTSGTNLMHNMSYLCTLVHPLIVLRLLEHRLFTPMLTRLSTYKGKQQQQQQKTVSCTTTTNNAVNSTFVATPTTMLTSGDNARVQQQQPDKYSLSEENDENNGGGGGGGARSRTHEHEESKSTSKLSDMCSISNNIGYLHADPVSSSSSRYRPAATAATTTTQQQANGKSCNGATKTGYFKELGEKLLKRVSLSGSSSSQLSSTSTSRRQTTEGVLATGTGACADINQSLSFDSGNDPPSFTSYCDQQQQQQQQPQQQKQLQASVAGTVTTGVAAAAASSSGGGIGPNGNIEMIKEFEKRLVNLPTFTITNMCDDDDDDDDDDDEDDDDNEQDDRDEERHDDNDLLESQKTSARHSISVASSPLNCSLCSLGKQQESSPLPPTFTVTTSSNQELTTTTTAATTMKSVEHSTNATASTTKSLEPHEQMIHAGKSLQFLPALSMTNNHHHHHHTGGGACSSLNVAVKCPPASHFVIDTACNHHHHHHHNNKSHGNMSAMSIGFLPTPEISNSPPSISLRSLNMSSTTSSGAPLVASAVANTCNTLLAVTAATMGAELHFPPSTPSQHDDGSNIGNNKQVAQVAGRQQQERNIALSSAVCIVVSDHDGGERDAVRPCPLSSSPLLTTTQPHNGANEKTKELPLTKGKRTSTFSNNSSSIGNERQREATTTTTTTGKPGSEVLLLISAWINNAPNDFMGIFDTPFCYYDR